MGTFGPAYSEEQDWGRLAAQREVIRLYMLGSGRWLSLREIARDLLYPESSVSAQLRHLRKPAFGGYLVDKRRRNSEGCWEYRVSRSMPFDASGQGLLFEGGLNAKDANGITRHAATHRP